MDSLPISFIVPVYNVETYLDDCVSSLVQASLPGDEIVLVDDGSTDASGAMCEDWRARHPGLVRLLRQANRGLSAARNAGLHTSRHRYVLFMDSDDAVVPATVAQARELLARFEPDVLVCDFFWWHPTPSPREVPSRTLSHAPQVLLRDSRAFTTETMQDFLLSACSRFFSRTLLERLGDAPFPVGVAYEEVATVPRLTLRADSLVYLPQPLFKYRMRAGSITHHRSTKNCVDRCASLRPFIAELQAAGAPAALQRAANARLAHQMVMAMRDCGLMVPQQPALYRQLADSLRAALSVPLPGLVLHLLRSPARELRKAGIHVGQIWASPRAYVWMRRLVYRWQRGRLAQRQAQGRL